MRTKTTKHPKSSGRPARAGLVLVLGSLLCLGMTGTASAAAADMLHNSLTTSSTKWSGTYGGWGITGGKYGAFDCTTCHVEGSSNIKRIRPSITTPDGSKGNLPGHNQPVQFTRIQGTRGVSPGTLGDDGFSPRTSSNRICEICHTWDPLGTNGVTVHSYSTPSVLDDHLGSDADDCISCHKHSTGFAAPECDSCHGHPPIVSSPGGTPVAGLAATPHTTGSVSAGSHAKHYYSYGITNCLTCHNNYPGNMPQLSTVPALSNKGDISISFNTFGFTTGNYSGQANVSYNNVAGSGAMTCTTVYCHSQGIRGGPGTYATATWGKAASGACGTCHGVNHTTPPGSLTHSQHVGSSSTAMYKYACIKCHDTVSNTADSTVTPTVMVSHVNGTQRVAFDSYNPSGSYNFANCSNLYCHSIGNTSVTTGLPAVYSGSIYASPSWSPNANLGCNACHGRSNAKGYPDYASGGSGTYTANSHSKHSDPAASNLGCDVCHYLTTTNSTTIRPDIRPTRHVNKSTQDVSFNTTSNPTASFSQAGHSCSSTYCHGSTTTEVWGGPSMSCASCHGANNQLQGKHSQHYESATTATWRDAVETTTASAYIYNCGVCHYQTPHSDGEAVSGIRSAQVVFDPTIAGGGTYNPGAFTAGTDTGGRKWTAGATNNACQNTYCHSKGTTVVSGGVYSAPVYSSLSWTGSYTLGCNGCHGDPANLADTSGRPMYANNTLKKNSHDPHETTCDVCHSATTTDGSTIANKVNHQNRAYNVGPKAGDWRTFTYTFANDGSQCSTNVCHAGLTAKWGTMLNANPVSREWDCVSCHSYSFKKNLSTGTIRQVVARAGTNGDFKMTTRAGWAGGTRHLYAATTIIKWDCIVCHREGYAQGINTGRVNWGYHNDGGGLVHLRNMDTTNESAGWAINNRTWRTIDYRDLDEFCLACHDSDGAAAIFVNATNNGLGGATNRALTPFNTTDVTNNSLRGSSEVTVGSEQRGAPRVRITDVRTQFNPGSGGAGAGYNGNPSQHAVIGQRYSSKNSRWNTSNGLAWTTVWLKKMGTMMRSVGETALLSCADCHILDANNGAHGGRYMYNLWGTGPGTLMTVTNSNNAPCHRCHNRVVYDGAPTAPGLSRIDHGNLCQDNPFVNADGSRFGNTCQLCHAGFWYTGNGMTTVQYRQSYGGIHGAWGTYAGPNGQTGKYRFFPGTHMMGARPGAGDGGWASGFSAVSWTCYFPNAGDVGEGFNNCIQHNAGTDTSRIGSQPPYGRPLRY